VGDVLSLLFMNENSVLLGADVVSRRLALDAVCRRGDAGLFSRGPNAKVRSRSLNSVLSSNTAKLVLRSLVGLNDLGATISNLRSPSPSLAILEVNLGLLV